MLEEKLIRYVKQTYLPERYRGKSEGFTAKDLHFFAPAIAELSAAFTADRVERPKNYLSRKEYRSAYLLYFFLTNYTKTLHCLAELDALGKLPIALHLHCLDVGAGPGTAAIACAHYYSEHHPACQLNILAIEQNDDALRDARHLFSALVDPRHAFSIQRELFTARPTERSLKNKTFDLIFAVNFLNELPSREEQYSLCRTLLQRSSGAFVVIEPALRKQTRDLMALRDRLLEQGDAAVLAPCLHQQRCPMLAANKRDWCHFYLDWECPTLIRDIDRLIGNKHDYLKMAYFIFAPLLRKEGKGEEHRSRVVSSPMHSKGKTELLLCGGDGKLNRMTELDRQRKRGTLPFGGAKRGDIYGKGVKS